MGDDDDKALSLSNPALEELLRKLREGAPLADQLVETQLKEQVVALRDGGSLQVSAAQVLTIQGISPQLAAHQKGLAEIEAETQVQTERIKANALVDVEKARGEAAVRQTEMRYLKPTQLMVRQNYVIVGVLTLAGGAGLWMNQPGIVIASIVTMGGLLALKVIGKLLGKGGGDGD